MNEEKTEPIPNQEETYAEAIDNTKSGAVKELKSNILTKEYLEQYLKEGTFDRAPTQTAISFPLIEKYVKMLENGQEPPEIKVEDKAIVDGHHRYISGHICGKIPLERPYVRPQASEVRAWSSVSVDSVDYQSDYDTN
ncbi:MAG TPA: hypothetical protein VNX01_04930 [Bacteroidia bacterium]|jgi:hypothetical protein|nr:hypothetical protein [Bacteroidia bacterium]